MIPLKAPFKIKTFGDSMMPLFYGGDVLFIGKINFKKIKVNDIVCARKNNKVFTHRVIYRQKKYLITKGDNTFATDGKIYAKNLIGIVIKAQRDKHIFTPETLYLLQSTIYLKEILKVKKRLEKEKVDYVFLKGLPLYLHYVGEIPRRLYGDCDLLIEKRHYKRVDRILKDSGYRAKPSKLSVEKRIEKKGEISFYKIINELPIFFDIHTEITLAKDIRGTQLLFSRSKMKSLTVNFIKQKTFIIINREKFPVLNTQYLQLYLVLHLFRHSFRLPYRYDLLLLTLKKHDISKTLLDLIAEYKMEHFAYLVIFILKKHFSFKFKSELIGLSKADKRKMKFMKNYAKNLDIFSTYEPALEQFKTLFLISSAPIYIKFFSIVHPYVLKIIIMSYLSGKTTKSLLKI